MNIIRKLILDEITYIVQDKTQEIFNNSEKTFEEKQEKLKQELKKIYSKSYSTNTFIKRLDYIEHMENLQISYLPSILTGVIASSIMLVATEEIFTKPFSFMVEFIKNAITATDNLLITKIITLLLCILVLVFLVLLICIPIFLSVFFLFSNKILMERNDLLYTYDYEKEELLLKAMAKSKKDNKKMNKSNTSKNNQLQNSLEESTLDKFKLEVIPIIISISFIGMLYNLNSVNTFINNHFNNGGFYVCLFAFITLYILSSWLIKKTRLRNLIVHGGKR